MSAFVVARENCSICNTTGLDIETLIDDASEEITEKFVSTVDRRTFWFVTSSEEAMNKAIANWGVNSSEIVYINREQKLDTNTVPGTQSFYQV